MTGMHFGEASFIRHISTMNQDIAIGYLDVAVMSVGNADESSPAQTFRGVWQLSRRITHSLSLHDVGWDENSI